MLESCLKIHDFFIVTRICLFCTTNFHYFCGPFCLFSFVVAVLLMCLFCFLLFWRNLFAIAAGGIVTQVSEQNLTGRRSNNDHDDAKRKLRQMTE